MACELVAPVFQKYEQELLSFIKKKLKDPIESEEILDQVLMKVYHHCEKLPEVRSKTTTKTYWNNDKTLMKQRQNLNINRFKDDKTLTAIAQHNELVFARYSMTYWEMRIFICLLAQIKKTDKAFEPYQIPVSLLNENARGGDYKTILDASNRLLRKTVHFYDKNNKEWIGRTLMAECRYKEGEGYVVAKFNELMKPYLLELQGNYTLSALKHLNNLKSSNAFRLYQILRTRLFNTNGQSVVKDQEGYRMELGFLKYLLELDNQYPRFYDFKKRVLDVVQKELDQTDLSFRYKPIKEGRVVKGILFKITGKPEPIQLGIFGSDYIFLPDHNTENEFTPRALKILEGWGLSQKQISNIMQADHQQICKVSYAMKMEKPSGINVTGWAYSEFFKRLGLFKS